MTADKVRADYEQLTQIAQAFGQQAETAQQVLGALQDNMETLQGGDWVGKGADAFYAEMNSAVVPAMKRVVAAMKEAANATTKISRIMKQAEDDAAALFRLDGGNSASGGAAGLGAVFGAAGAVGAALGDMPAANGGAPGPVPGGAGISAFGGTIPEQPPTAGTTKGAVEDAVALAGATTEVISILEAGGIIAKAGVGTTIGAFVLPIGTFLLGLKWGLEAEEYEKRVAEFKRKMLSSAIMYSVERMKAAYTKADGSMAWPFDADLNEKGKRYLNELDRDWKAGMNAELNQMLRRHMAAQIWDSVEAPTVEEWQALHDKWAHEAWSSLEYAYGQPQFRKPNAFDEAKASVGFGMNPHEVKPPQ